VPWLPQTDCVSSSLSCCSQWRILMMCLLNSPGKGSVCPGGSRSHGAACPGQAPVCCWHRVGMPSCAVVSRIQQGGVWWHWENLAVGVVMFVQHLHRTHECPVSLAWGCRAELGECRWLLRECQALRGGKEGSWHCGGHSSCQAGCAAPFLPLALRDASCLGTVTPGSQLCPVSSVTNKCSRICRHLLLAFAVQRCSAASSASVPVPLRRGTVLLWPWLALPAPKPGAGTRSWRGWQSPACPQLCTGSGPSPSAPWRGRD